MNSYKLRINLQRIFIHIVICGVLFFCIGVLKVDAALMNKSLHSDTNIVEHIRLSVPAKDRSSWLIAEKKSWEPWLEKKEGFLGRDLFWDQKEEEAILLIRWSSRDTWKSIPQQEIDHVQELFEQISRDLTHKDIGNPFPIRFEGELLPQ